MLLTKMGGVNLKNNAIVSLAILKVNFDERKDYLETFVPIVAEAIRCAKSEIVSIYDIQSEIRKNFGLNIPQNAVKAILKKAKKENFIYIDKGMYKRNNSKLKTMDFHSVQQGMLKKQEQVVNALVEHCNTKFSLKWSYNEAEIALQDYIEDNQIFRLKNRIIPKVENKENCTRYYVALFIQQLLDDNSYLLEYLDDAIKGMMISATLFVTDAARIRENFKETNVYLDTTFIIYSLGYAGKTRQEPCKELLAMLYESGARIRCFSHTVLEIDGVLTACASKIANKDLYSAYGPSIEYFITEGKTSSDIMLLVSQLERNMNLINIKITDTPPYNNRCYIDEQDLNSKLSEEIGYRNVNAIERDVDSVSAILRLRKGKNYARIEDCRALFVTTNSNLVNFINSYLNKGEEINGAMPLISDYTLTNLLWLKSPMKIPDLPRKKIIADCFAATQPDERLWNKYIEEINKLSKYGEIKEDESYYFKYAPLMKGVFMEVTESNGEVICEGTVKEIMELSRKRIEVEARRDLEEKNKVLEKKLKDASKSEEKQYDNIEAFARKQAKNTGSVISIVLMAAVIIALLCSLPIVTFSKFNINVKIVALVALVVFIILTLINLWRGTTIKEIANHFEEKKYISIIKQIKRDKKKELLEVAVAESREKSTFL